VYLVGFHALAQGGVDHLVARNRTLAGKCSGHDGGVPVAAVTPHLAMVARQSTLNKGFNLFCGHNISLVYQERIL
jgi:hypothetical protein